MWFRDMDMNWLKNMLIVVALLITAWPCTHADNHPDSSTDHETISAIGESHHCSCHTCEHTVCTEDLEAQQTLAMVPVLSVVPSSDLLLLVLSETKPVVRRMSGPVYDPLVALQTVQLLI